MVLMRCVERPMNAQASPRRVATEPIMTLVPKRSPSRPTRVRGSEARKVAIMYAPANCWSEISRSARMASLKAPTTKDWPGLVAMVVSVVTASMIQP